MKSLSSSLKLSKLINFAKRAGFILPTSSIYGGLKGSYDFGSLGVELKRNLASEWWRDTVYKSRGTIVGVDTAIIQHPKTWIASGHHSRFHDVVCRDKLSGFQFRVDKARPVALEKMPLTDSTTLFIDGEKLQVSRLVLQVSAKELMEKYLNAVLAIIPNCDVEMDNQKIILKVCKVEEPDKIGSDGWLYIMTKKPAEFVKIAYRGYVCPTTNSPFLSGEQIFSGMMTTTWGQSEKGVEPLVDQILAFQAAHPNATKSELLAHLQKATNAEHASSTNSAGSNVVSESLMHLRPETAQGIFAQFKLMYETCGVRDLPFGIAQIGKAFRNETDVEHALFRTREFEQMELEYFIHPSETQEVFTYWTNKRMNWWKSMLQLDQNETRFAECLRLREQSQSELAHYASRCSDIEYQFPWGWGEIEGIAARGSHDLDCHSAASGCNMSVEKDSENVVPHVIEPSAGLSRGLLAVLDAAFAQTGAYEEQVISKGKDKKNEQMPSSSSNKLPAAKRFFLPLHPKLAPYKVALLPIVSNPDLISAANETHDELVEQGIVGKVLSKSSLGSRFQKMDTAGTPYCVTYDSESLNRGECKIRDRDTGNQEIIAIRQVFQYIREKLNEDRKKQ